MNLTDVISITSITTFTNLLIGYWLKSKIESTIKHNNDKNLEKIKSDLKRSDLIYTERIIIFKLLQKKLVSIRRYCDSQISVGSGNEYETQPENLDIDDKKPILKHSDELNLLLDENLIFLSILSKEVFKNLNTQLSLSFSMEIALDSNDPDSELFASRINCYQAIIDKINNCIDALYNELEPKA